MGAGQERPVQLQLNVAHGGGVLVKKGGLLVVEGVGGVQCVADAAQVGGKAVGLVGRIVGLVHGHQLLTGLGGIGPSCL